MLRSQPIVVDFQEIGKLLVPFGGNNPISAFPDCVSLKAYYEDSANSNSTGAKDLIVYLAFGAQRFALKNSCDDGLERQLTFSMRLHSAQLELLAIENVHIKQSSLLGIDAPTKSATVTRKTRAAINSGVKREGKAKGKIGDSLSVSASGEVTGDSSKTSFYNADVISETTTDFIKLIPSNTNQHRWELLPELIYTRGREAPTVQSLDGHYFSKTKPLLTFKRNSKTEEATLLLGVSTFLPSITFDFDENKDNKWWEAQFKRKGYNDKTIVAQELLREYIRKSIGINDMPNADTDRVFFAIAAATQDDF